MSQPGLIAFGRPFIANPDLVERLKSGAPLAQLNPATLYGGRPVILFNYAGVASSTGENATTVDGMADHVATFVKALGLSLVDVLGFSIGGFVAQSFAQRYPVLVRRLVLVGTGPRNGETSP